jgi:hypothetical protein
LDLTMGFESSRPERVPGRRNMVGAELFGRLYCYVVAVGEPVVHLQLCRIGGIGPAGGWIDRRILVPASQTPASVSRVVP